jgi:protoporphyrinogen oxidase/glycosyltransferase involved in cell wall biosynthesis
MNELVVFSHLRWNFVYQRPQQILSRLARRFRILFVEEPRYASGDPRALRSSPARGVTVLTPHTPLTAPGFHDDQIPLLQKLVGQAIAREHFDAYGAWLYTPMALPLLTKLSPRIIVYDCMDELPAFKAAPRQLVQRENALLRIANVVFCGGPSLYESRRARHCNVHLFPSSVDREHFARGADAANAHAEVKALGRPRLGFFGVLDERLDTELLAGIAERRPEWEICLVGPVLKIDKATLPQAPNLHYFGQRDYAELPAFLAGWDLAILPFARNESTRCISPTKTLEYMAAGRSIVSTRVGDVERLYGEVVRFADTPDDFVAACEAALVEPEAARSERRALMQRMVASTSWDETAREMRRRIEAAASGGLTEAARMMLEPARAPKPAVPTPSATSGAPCVILGAGPTGLSAAYHYGEGCVLLEREANVGGWCRSIEDTGFTFDHAGHIMFSDDPYVQDLYRLLLGDNVHWQEREAWIHSRGVYTRYPFQGALHGLPPEVLRECLVGAIEARFGTLARNGDGRDVAGADVKDCCADATGVTTREAIDTSRDVPRNFEEFIFRTWGAGVAKHFALPYNRKLWTVPLTEMETSWPGGRVPLPDLEEMIEGALSPVPKPMGPNARFGYPLRGGFQALMNGFLPLLRSELLLQADVEKVSPLLRIVTLRDGRRFHYDTLISTMPLPLLIAAMGDEAPPEIRRAASELRHVSIRCVNLGVARPHLSDKHWIYFPEDTVFHRVFLQGNASPHCNPPGGFGLTCEISYSPSRPLPATGQALVQRCVDDCVRVGLLDSSDALLTANQVDMPYAYVVYDHGRAERVGRIRQWLAKFDVILAGRYSEWEYYNSDHAFIAGKKAAEAAQQLARMRVTAKSA